MFSSLRNLLNRHAPNRDEVRQRLNDAMAAGTRLELEPCESITGNRPLIVVSLEKIETNYFITSQPPSESARHLFRGKRYHVNYFDKKGRVTGETIFQGRIRSHSENQSVTYGYRFSLPNELTNQAQRVRRQDSMELSHEIEVELSSFKHRSPIFGRTTSLGSRGAKIKCKNAMNKLQVGQDVYLKMQLPAPVGLVAEMVRITDLLPCSQSRELMVAVSFHKPIANFDLMLDRGMLSTVTKRAG